ncbi:MAG: hypothetical protein ABIR63_02350 [Sphingomicrobium sp.]
MVDGSLWVLVDVLAPAVLLLGLVALIATAKPDPERALHRQPAAAEGDSDSRTRRRRRRTRLD